MYIMARDVTAVSADEQGSGDEIIFEPVETLPLNDRVVQILRDAILTGKLRPGARLNETRLARELRMSRIPLREALHRLEEQGLVVNVPRRGRFVVSLTEEEVQQIISLRLLLETEALMLCRANLVRSGEAQLASLVYRWEENIGSMSPAEAAELDLQIHRTIWNFTGNEYLVRTLTSLLVPLFAYRVIRKLNVELEKWGSNTHIPLLEFVQGKSQDSAFEVMLRHLRFGWENPERFSSAALQCQSRA
jgi:DNA-binding GntR family transcriptional regulator